MKETNTELKFNLNTKKDWTVFVVSRHSVPSGKHHCIVIVLGHLMKIKRRNKYKVLRKTGLLFQGSVSPQANTIAIVIVL